MEPGVILFWLVVVSVALLICIDYTLQKVQLFRVVKEENSQARDTVEYLVSNKSHLPVTIAGKFVLCGRKAMVKIDGVPKLYLPSAKTTYALSENSMVGHGISVFVDPAAKKITILTDEFWEVRVISPDREIKAVFLEGGFVTPTQAGGILVDVDHLVTPERKKIRFRDQPRGEVDNYLWEVTRVNVSEVIVTVTKRKA